MESDGINISKNHKNGEFLTSVREIYEIQSKEKKYLSSNKDIKNSLSKNEYKSYSLKVDSSLVISKSKEKYKNSNSVSLKSSEKKEKPLKTSEKNKKKDRNKKIKEGKVSPPPQHNIVVLKPRKSDSVTDFISNSQNSAKSNKESSKDEIFQASITSPIKGVSVIKIPAQSRSPKKSSKKGLNPLQITSSIKYPQKITLSKPTGYSRDETSKTLFFQENPIVFSSQLSKKSNNSGLIDLNKKLKKNNKLSNDRNEFSNNFDGRVENNTENLLTSVVSKIQEVDREFKKYLTILRFKSSEALGDMFRYLYLYTSCIGESKKPDFETVQLNNGISDNFSQVLENSRNIIESFKWYMASMYLGAPNGLLYHRLSILSWQSKSVLKAICFGFLSVSSTNSFPDSRENLLVYIERAHKIATSTFKSLRSGFLDKNSSLSSLEKKNSYPIKLTKNKQSAPNTLNGKTEPDFSYKEKHITFIQLLGIMSQFYFYQDAQAAVDSSHFFDYFFSPSPGILDEPIKNIYTRKQELMFLTRNSFMVSWLNLHHMMFTKVGIDEFEFWIKSYYLPILKIYFKNISVSNSQFPKNSISIHETIKDMDPCELSKSLSLIRGIDYLIPSSIVLQDPTFCDGNMMALSDLAAFYSYGRSDPLLHELPYQVKCASILIKSTFSTMMVSINSFIENLIREYPESLSLGVSENSLNNLGEYKSQIPIISVKYVSIILLYLCYPKIVKNSLDNKAPSLNSIQQENLAINDSHKALPNSDSRHSWLVSSFSDIDFVGDLSRLLNNLKRVTKCKLPVGFFSDSRFNSEILSLLGISVSNFKYIDVPTESTDHYQVITSYKYQNYDELSKKIVTNPEFLPTKDYSEINLLFDLSMKLIKYKIIPIKLDEESEFFSVDDEISDNTIVDEGSHSLVSLKKFINVSPSISSLNIDIENLNFEDSDSLSDYEDDHPFYVDESHVSNIDKLKQEYQTLKNQLSKVSNRFESKKINHLNQHYSKNKDPSSTFSKNNLTKNKFAKRKNMKIDISNLIKVTLNKVGFVFDTNCYIESLTGIIEFLNYGLFNLYVPLAVLMELDGLKYNPYPLGPASSNAVNFIEKNFEKNSINLNKNRVSIEINQRLDLAKNISFKNSLESSGNLRIITMKGSQLSNLKFRTEQYHDPFSGDSSNVKLRSIDDVIITTCLNVEDTQQGKMTLGGNSTKDSENSLVPNLNSKTKIKIVLVTSDVNMRIKATMLGITTVSYRTFTKWFKEYKSGET
ncbi:hypothetical protein AYI68_g2284 [Smittium mucronatum]|uniref:PIN domain-containing protein n=1 Tax=Smittium mucronatum TaxID=133383 RepID=A0A1R0H3A6_9FUNG|nr:hypothetical protein AYI68_g2284 [Smittium mucronatum]